jgi:hypothetical protein
MHFEMPTISGNLRAERMGKGNYPSVCSFAFTPDTAHSGFYIYHRAGYVGC